MSKKTLSELFRRWSKPSRGVPVDVAARNRARLRLEEVEHRVVPATLPPVTATDTRVIAAGAFAPQAVADPTNPNTIVVVSGSTANGINTRLNGQITRDGGQTWTNFTIANPDTGVNAGPGGAQLSVVGTPSVAFSRTGDLYIAWTSMTPDLTSAGVLRVASFTVEQTLAPLAASPNPAPVQYASVNLYQWLNQDPVYNPVVAVDNLLDEFTDPDTQTATLQDTMQRANGSGKAVYVAWNTNAVAPTVNQSYQGFTGPFTPTAIFAAASRDRGVSWTTPITVNNSGGRSGFFATLDGITGIGGVAPQIKFTPGDLNPETVDTAGRLQFFWQRPNGDAVMDITQPDEDNDASTNNIDVEVTTNYISPTGPSKFIQEAGIDPNNGPDFPATTTSTITVAIDPSATSTNGAFFEFLQDIDVTVALNHPHLNQLLIQLVPPNNLQPIDLVRNRIGADGNQIPTGGVPQGLTDNNDTSGNSGLGVVNLGAGTRQPGTVFSAEAARLIFDPVNVAAPRSATGGYVAHYRPEGGSLASLYGTDVATLNGDWVLRITDFRDDDRGAGPVAGNPQLRYWNMQMSSLIRPDFGTDRNLAFEGVSGAGGAANLGGSSASAATAPAGAAGFNAGFSYAYDLSQGSFSPYSGRLYTAYASAAGNILTRYSDDQGLTWSFFSQINDDSVSDNFSEGNRSQFQPTITVDPVTGTVIAMWYDARWDASNARVATFMATSLDGGETWSVQDKSAFLNLPKTAIDQLNRDRIVLEPLPTNLRAINTATPNQESGQRQSMLAYGGQIKAYWTGNENAAGASVYTATIQTSAGPRVVDNDLTLNTDQGAVTVDSVSGDYNNTFTADGTRRIDGFTFSFDRLVDVSTVSPEDIIVLYRAPGTDRTVAATRIPVAAVTALDADIPVGGFPANATRFFVSFETQQSAPGTYSYAIGPNVADRIRTPRIAMFTPPDTPTAIPDLGRIESTISVPTLAGSPAPTVANMEVKVDILHNSSTDLRVTLFGPDPDGDGPQNAPSVVLSNRRGLSSGIRFNDAATSKIEDFPGALIGIYQPETPLNVFNTRPIQGEWTLRVEDLEGNISGTLLGWTITFLDINGAPVRVLQSQTYMDQDGDTRTREVGTNYDNNTPASAQPPRLYTDAYTAPGSSGRDQFNIEPFAGPLVANTLPLISAGPHLVLVGNPGETAVVSFATRNAANTQVLNVTLDRPVDISTFDESDVVAVVSQTAGPVTNLINVVPTNASNEIASQFDFVFASALPSGKYSVSLGNDFLVADGMFRNVEADTMLVRFDRDIDPATFTAQNVLRITGPIGDIQDVQDITVLGSTGTFTVTFTNASGSQTTPPLPVDIAASGGLSATSSLQNAIAALSNVGSGNVVVTVENLVGGGRVFHVVFTGLLRSTQLPMTAAGSGGATATVNQVGIRVAPVDTTFNAVTGGYRAFFVSFPKQNISGPYTLEFGQNPLGQSIRAVDVPQLVTVITTPTTTVDVTFQSPRNEVQQVRVLGNAGTFTLSFNGQPTNALPFNATADQVRVALESLPGIDAGDVTVTLVAGTNTHTYTITFTGALANQDVAQLAVTGAGGATASTSTTVQGRSDNATAASLLRVTGPNGAVNTSGVTATRKGTSSTFEFTFQTPLAPGQYVLDFSGLNVEDSGPAIDMNFNAGLDTLRGDDPASNDLDPLAYSSTGPVAIPPANPVGFDVNPTITESYIVIDEDYIIRQSTLEQIRVLLNISHPDMRDLSIDLVPPDATGVAPIRLFTGPLATNLTGTASANFENTLLVDRVGDPNVTNIQAGTAPFRSGSSFYSPQTPLSALVGKSTKGVWTLRVLNEGTNTQTSDPNFVTGDPIQISDWTLTLPRALTIESQRFDRTSGVAIDPAAPVVIATTRQGTASVSEIQTVSVTGTNGTFNLSFGGATTPSLQRASTALQVQNALNALSTIGGVGGSVTVSVVVTGNNRVFTVTFGGTLANRDVAQMTSTVSSVVSTSSINIPVDFEITETTLNQIRMLLNITHPNVRDLDIDLIGPDNTTVRIFTGSLLAPTASNQSANFTNTRFANRVGDPSTPSIQTAIPPFNAGEAGFFSPQNSLDPFVGKRTLGTWTIRVTNRGANSPTSDPNFDPSAPIQITNWNITFPKEVPTTGLGQSNADRFQAAFRIFTADPTNSLTQTTWMPVGPAPTNETANSARISAMAVDPTDPTGNTVFVAVAGGGIWKTTDFLNSGSALQNGGIVPRGPSYVPLTDFGPTSAVNVSSIAVFPRNNDPHQTIIFALTGEPATEGSLAGPYTQAGVGVLRSLDGGRSWSVLDSRTNADAAGNIVLMSDSSTRDHLFVGATGHKIVVDPVPGKDGGVIAYMALSGNVNQNGLWRTLNGGNTWTRVMAGDATDVVLAAGSANSTDPATGETVFQGNLQKLFAAFRSTPLNTGPGVYKTDSAPAAVSLAFMAGGNTNPLIRDISIPGSPQITTNLNPWRPGTAYQVGDRVANGINGPNIYGNNSYIAIAAGVSGAAPGPQGFGNAIGDGSVVWRYDGSATPNNGNRTLLAVPALTGEPLKDSFLQDWVYAMTDDFFGTQLYLSKDAGAHWTKVRIPTVGFGTNNEDRGFRGHNSVGTIGDYTMALAVDPENPYIVYMAGSGTGSIRLDLTKMRDAHNFTFYNNSDLVLGPAPTPQFPNPPRDPANAANPAFTTQVNSNSQTIGGLQPQIFIPPGQTTGTPARGQVLIGGEPIDIYEDDHDNNPLTGPQATGFLNLFGGRDYNQPFTSNSLIRVRNTGNFPQSTLAGFFLNDGADITWSPFSDILDPNVPSQTLNDRTENRFFGINTHTILSMVDPVTGKTRLLFGTDDGVFTGVDSASTIGTGTLTNGIGYSGTVNGNRNGNLQVSQFYSGAVQPSQLAADLAGALFYGMGDQSGFPVSSPNILASGNLNWRGPTGHGASVLVDQAGSGTAFQYRSPGSFGFDQNQTATNLDFFRVFSNTADHAFSGGFSRTGSSSGSLFDQGDSWPNTTAYNFPFPIPQPNANPSNPNVLIFGSLGGRVYRTTNQGVTWELKGQPTDLDGTPVISGAFGASDPALPTLVNNFMYAGTNGGRIYSTTTGGTPWTLIGSNLNGLDGESVIRIIPNPQVSKKDVFALTTSGVFYKADGTTATGNWVNVTGNLFSLTRTVFGNPADLDTALRPNSLTSLAVDWRYAFPQPLNPSQTFPMLYAAGDGGVFRTMDFGTNWTFFPDVAGDGAAADGGYLPNTHITDLDLSIGNLDPNTGRYQAGGFNMLVATTYGRGTFAIRLDPNIPDSSFVSGPRVTQLINPNPVNGPSSQLHVRFSGPVDPATFTPDDILLLGPSSRNEVQTVTVTNGAAVNTFTLTFNGQTTNAIPYGALASVVETALNALPEIGVNGVSVVAEDVAGGIQYTVTFDGPNVRYEDQNSLVATGTGFPNPVVATTQEGSPPITVTSVNMISVPNASGVNPRDLFAITFPTQSALGSYDIVIGDNPAGNDVPLISDPSGFLMNQDNDTVNGESIVDQYRTTIVLNSNTNQRLVVTQSPATGVAGEPYDVRIEARDANDVLLTNVNGTLTLSPGLNTGTFTPTTAQVINGVAMFSVIYQSAGVQTINATLPTLNSTAWSTTIVAGAATQFSVSPVSSTVPSGATRTFTVTAQDQFGNRATTYTNEVVTLTTNGVAAVVPSSITLVNGIATFDGTFNVAGNVQITATGSDPSNPPSGTLTGTANVVVTPGTATQISIAISNGPYVIGTTATVTVTARDSQGNIASNLNGTSITTSVSPSGQTTVNPTNPVFVNGVATYTITFNAAGTYNITNTANGPISGTLGPITVTAAPPPPSPTENLPGIYAVGSGVNGSQFVTVYNGDGTERTKIEPFPPGYNLQVDPAGGGFFGGIRTAVGDVTGDNIPDYIIGSGPTLQASVTVFNGANGKRILDYKPFEDFTGGVFVTTGDITGDGIDEIIMTPDEGGGPRVTVLRGGDFARIFNFFGIRDENFRGGARPAAGDLNGDGFAELIVAAGFGGGPRISIYEGSFLAQGKLVQPVGDFFIFEEQLRNGAYVAVGDVDGDGFGDLIAGAGPGGGPRVLVVSGKKLLEAGPDGPFPAIAAPIANFFAGSESSRGGVRVATKNIDLDRKAEVITGAGASDDLGNVGGSTVKVYLGANLDSGNFIPFDEFDYLSGYTGGVFVG